MKLPVAFLSLVASLAPLALFAQPVSLAQLPDAPCPMPEVNRFTPQQLPYDAPRFYDGTGCAPRRERFEISWGTTIGDNRFPAADAAGIVNAGASTQPPARRVDKFHWGRALAESGMFLAMQHAFLAWRDDRWITVENGIPFNHYWRDYMKSLNTWAHSGWDDGDPFLDNYIGHPIQGALTGYFQVQNDPKGAALEFSNTKPYWTSRLKAMAWNAAFSTQWELGPIGEMTVEKYGIWGAWKQNGKWVNGEGQVDLVITPVAGFGWMVGEDLLDRYVVRRVEASTGNRFVVAFTRCALNPIRGGANIMHGRKPWHRESRDRGEGRGPMVSGRGSATITRLTEQVLH